MSIRTTLNDMLLNCKNTFYIIFSSNDMFCYVHISLIVDTKVSVLIGIYDETTAVASGDVMLVQRKIIKSYLKVCASTA